MPLDPEQMMEWLAEKDEEIERLRTVVGYFRPEVLFMALNMEMELRNNDHRPGWKSDAARDLYNRLCTESNELAKALDGDSKGKVNADKVRKEAADVANFAMMVSDVSGAYPPQDDEHLSAEDVIYVMANVDPGDDTSDSAETARDGAFSATREREKDITGETVRENLQAARDRRGVMR